MMLNRLSLNRIGLNRIGLNRIGKPSGGSSDRPYIDPKVLDSLCGVWIMDQNTNESESRNIIKNKIADRGGDLELLNFGYKLNSGYNGYATDFTEWHGTYSNKTQTKITVSIDIYFPISIISFKNVTSAPSFRIKVSGLPKGQNLYYKYINEEGLLEEKFNIPSDGIYTLPATAVSDTPTTVATLANEQYNINIKGLTIEQLPLYEGALVTDGKDDMIVSQKSFIDIVGSVNQPYTIVSMMSFIDNIHFYFNSAVGTETMTISYVSESAIDKTHIFGYSTTNVQNTPNVINNILGDKNDYVTRREPAGSLIGKEFSIQGYLRDGIPTSVSSVAVYWTFIANKVLTTDEINQIIAYFKLDKYVTPQVIYDVKRQGLTNDTPAADWYLKDFSGNGHDMQLFNFLQAEDSGIGKYGTNYTKWTRIAGTILTKDKIVVTKDFVSEYWLCFIYTNVPAYKVRVSGLPDGCTLRYQQQTLVNGINELHALEGITSAVGFTVHNTGNIFDLSNLVIEQIPDYEGALVSDGKDDYGKAEGLPILKDYTVAVDRAIIGTNKQVDGGVSAKCLKYNNGSYVIDYLDGSFSYGGYLAVVPTIDRIISYQSKYVSNGKAISVGSSVDASDLYIAKLGIEERYSTIAVWSYLLFPYSLSEFLLERQLKKYKLGTLHLDMVEFRPVVKSNVEYSEVCYLNYTHNLATIKSGDYVNIGDTIAARIVLNNTLDEVANAKVNGQECEVVNVSPRVFDCKFIITSKSPQKIDITIDEYIRYEDMDFTSAYPLIPIIDGYTYGDKLKVGTEVNYVKFSNLLPNVYSRRGEMQLNGVNIENNTLITVSKYMVFSINKTWLLDTTEPHAIYSPQKLNIPNSSLKILGYVPDLTGKGNHGKLNNFAYTEDSGVAADGSIKFDGTDDHITIPTLAHGGKCVMMKVNWSNNGMLYDQRLNSSVYTFGILTGEATLAYNARNNGSTYIDGILNANIIPSDLVGITHNITAVNDAAIDNNTVSPRLGVSVSNATFSNQALYEFMLFPEIPSEDEIKKLNNVMGIEGGYVESPNYYWDSFGKSNNNKEDIDYDNLRQGTDANRQLIDKSVLGLKAIEDYIKTGNGSDIVSRRLYLNNVAYNSESGYTDDNGLLLDGVEDHAVNTAIPAVTDFTVIAKRTDLRTDGNIASFIQKGIFAGWNGGGAFSEGHWEGGLFYCSTFGTTRDINDVYNKELFWQTPTSYNGKSFEKGKSSDNSGLSVGVFINSVGGRTGYWKGVFYKMMLYTKTIDQLSINMLKNLFERDELIDVNNPIFKK